VEALGACPIKQRFAVSWAANLGLSRRMVTADNTIHFSATYPSRIVLPVLDAD
jgi:hypothetical protein